jgi:hypothetical protein
VILVLHSEDPEGERIETIVDAELTVETDGGPLKLAGQCLHNEEGTDVLFDLADHWDDVKNVPLDGYAVELKSVEYTVPPQSVTIDLSKAKNQPDIRTTSAATAVYKAFLTRLSYKSLETNANAVRGFANRILNDRGVMRFYIPAELISKPIYSAKVVSGALLDRNTFACAVEEEWFDGSGADMVYYRQTHKAVAEYMGGQWIVTEDEVVSD